MYEPLYLSLVGIVAMIIVAFVTPKIVMISKKGDLCDEPNNRKLNKKAVPTLGGIGIYLGILISTLIFTHGMDFSVLKYIFLVVTILLCVGVFDDIFNISAYIKFFYQLGISIMLISFAGVRITSLHGLMGIYELDYISSYLLSIVIIVGLVNAMNLIDGIDGLASALGIVAAVTLGILECYIGDLQYAVLAFSLAGALLAFMFFNVFASKNKIFMGDTGSTIIGALLALLVINICEAPIFNHQDFLIVSPPTFLLSVFVIPIFDTLRVISIRIFNGKSPVQPDKTHMHHWLLKFGFNHFYVTLILALITILMIAVNLLLQGINDNVLLAITVALGLIITGFPALFVKKIERMDCILLRRIAINIWKRTYGSRRLIQNIGTVIDRMK